MSVSIKVNQYIFNAGAKQITFVPYNSIELENITLIRNITTGAYIWRGNISTSIDGSVLGNVFTFTGPNTDMADTDDLIIMYIQPFEYIKRDYFPSTIGTNKEYGNIKVDPEDNLIVRGGVTTDEGSFRANFSGTSIGIDGTICDFTNGSNVVTGTGFANSEIYQKGEYIKLKTDLGNFWSQIKEILDDNVLILNENYQGTTTTGLSEISTMNTMLFGSANESIVTGKCRLTVSLAGDVAILSREVDVLPLKFQGIVSVSQRVSSDNITIGAIQPGGGSPRYWAYFKLDGTNNTVIKTQTAFSKSGTPTIDNIEEYTINLPVGLNTTNLGYRVEILSDSTRFYIFNTNQATFQPILVSEHKKVSLKPYDIIAFGCNVQRTSNNTDTTVDIDYFQGNNFNALQVATQSNSEVLTANTAPIQPFNILIAGVIAINTDIAIFDCSNFSSIFIQAISIGTGAVITPQWTDDPTFAVANRQTATLFTEAGVSGTTFNSAGRRITNRYGRWLIFRVTTGASGGTTNIVISGSQQTVQTFFATQPVSGTVTATLSANQIITPVPQTSQGASTYHRRLSTADTNLVSVKASAGVISSIELFNVSASVRYFKLYNKASAPVIATDVALMVKTFALFPNVPLVVNVGPFANRLATGIAYCIVGQIGDTDTTAIGANEVIVNITLT